MQLNEINWPDSAYASLRLADKWSNKSHVIHELLLVKKALKFTNLDVASILLSSANISTANTTQFYDEI